MPCLNLSNGPFSEKFFSNTNFNSGDLTITVTSSGLTVGHADFAGSAQFTGDCRYVVLGGNQFVAVRVSDTTNPASRRIFIVDFTVSGSTPGSVQIIQQPLVSSTTALPKLYASPGSESLVFVWTPTQTLNEAQGLGIFRSDNGKIVLPGPNNITLSGSNIGATITATELVINHPTAGPNTTTTGPRPQGESSLVAQTLDFGEAVLGASIPGLSTTERTAKIKNTGLDCLTISNIADSAPFALTPAARAKFPLTLQPNETGEFAIVFAPGATGNNITRTLAITRSPAVGDSVLTCIGDARNAEAKIATSTATLAYGTLPHPGTATKSFTVTNTGELTVSVTIAGPPSGSSFGWVVAPPPGLTLTPGQTSGARTVVFTTPGDMSAAPQTITVAPSQGASRTISCTGAGCIADARIQVPPVAPLDFAQIERGFRTVRLVEIANTGDGDLTFTARIAAGTDPAQAANFGLVLPQNDITDAPSVRSYSVLPTHRCGPGPVGNNLVALAVSFHADGASGAYGANLVIEGHNASNVPAAQSWTFPLSAEVIDPIPIDVALVIDRSGSMTQAIGTRNKMEAALTGSQLLVQMLRDTSEDRCTIVAFDTLPALVAPMQMAGPNRAALLGALGPGNFTPTGFTNIAGGAIVAAEQLATPHPGTPPMLKKSMVVLTDGVENRCFTETGASVWLSITGRDTGMYRPDNITAQTTDPWQPPPATKVYAIGLGAPTDVDSTALSELASGTGASYQGAEDLTGKQWFLLEKYYTQVFMETAGLSQIQDPFYTIQPGTKHSHEFDIWPGDVNTMVVIYDVPGQRLPFELETPRGEVITGTMLPPGFGIRYRSTPTARFAEVTFPAKEPDRYAGTWRAVVRHDGYTCAGDVGGTAKPDDKDGRADDATQDGFLPRKCRKSGQPVDYGIAIGAGSNLRLQPWVDPVETYLGDSFRLNATLSEAGLALTGANVHVVVKAPGGQQWTVPLRDDGMSDDAQKDDGDYGGRFGQTYVEGNYQLTFVAEGVQGGRAFRREAHRTKPVLSKRRSPPGGRDPRWCRKLAVLLGDERLVKLLEEDRRDDPQPDKPRSAG